MTIAMLTADALDMDHVCHGFFTREGGVSQGLYASLNGGSGSDDKPDLVAENRRRIAKALGAEALVSNYQVHGRGVTIVDSANQDRRHQADALVTTRPGLALGILTADCVPVLFADSQHRVVAAAHAGWRGALAGVTDATLGVMTRCGAHLPGVAAAIGPAIQQASYEVGTEVQQQFLAADPANALFFAPGRQDDKYQLDLPGYVAHRLTAAGVRKVARLDLDTYADEGRFFSYRRATHRGEPDYGRHVSAISLK